MRKLLNEELNRLNKEEFQKSAKIPIIVVLDNVRSHLNVGSVFRTSDAFRIEAIYLCGITGTPPHRDIQKTALGATETVTWKYLSTTMAAIITLKNAGYQIAAIEQATQATMLQAVKYNGNDKIAVVFGNEVEGVQQSVVDDADMVIEIPQLGTKHSLNIAVSAGVVLWEMVRKYV